VELKGGDYELVSWIKFHGLFRIRDFFLVLFCCNHIMSVKIMNVIIFLCFHTFTLLCGMW
jgi:hypothetical protein